MERVILKKFKAFTGRLFDSEDECKKYESLINKINKIMNNLNPIPDDIEFQNGGGYIKQDKDKVKNAKREILEIGRKLYKTPDLSFGWMSRYADDSSNIELYTAWGRLSNIDIQYREWGQGYYAANPDKGIQKEWTK